MTKSDPIPCTKEEIERIIQASMEDDFYYMFFKVAKTTGRRLGEYYNVKVKDIDFDKNLMITLVLKKRRKVEREAILTPEISEFIHRYIIKNKMKLDDYVFRKVGYRQIQNKVKFYAKKAEIKHNVSFHNFRHYFITELVKKGWSYDKIAKLTGHTSVGTISVYDHAIASDIKEDALEALKDI